MAIKMERNDDLDKLFESFAIDPKAKNEVDKRQAIEKKLVANLDENKTSDKFIKSKKIDDVRANNTKVQS
ncbi:MAG: hypothetical protein LBS33_05340 [Streptococcaceae bacterium]|jgi:hypothetical protein|nr:hypothetical protein [Streptococcaceae bacterium]